MKKYSIALLALVLVSPLLLGACSRAIDDRIDDATITTRVKTALLNDPELGARRIDVETSGGVVTLSGAVTRAEERQRAVAIARKISGVADVRDALQVQQ